MVLKDNEGNLGATKTAEEQQKSIGKLFEKKRLMMLKALKQSKMQMELRLLRLVDNKNEISTSGAKKDAVIAARIALRVIAKNGKLVAKNEEKSEHEVNGVERGKCSRKGTKYTNSNSGNKRYSR